MQRIFANGRVDLDLGIAPALVHGDCHLDNVLLDDDGALVLTDWANSGVGDPSADLAFALTRSIPTGARPDEDAIVAGYATAAGLDRATLSRAVLAHRLQFTALQFPNFLGYLDQVHRDRLRTKFVRLSRVWLRAER